MMLRRISEKRRARLAGMLLYGSTFVRSVAEKVRRGRDTGPSRSARQVVRERSGGWCEFPGCIQRAVHVHHRLNRKMGGRHGAMAEWINQPAWLLDVCAHHHERVTSAHGPARVQAVGWGWVLAEGQDAEDVPVWTAHQWGPVFLLNDGSWRAP